MHAAIARARRPSDHIAVPKTFYDDHADRALPTPVAYGTTRNRVWISLQDEALEELLADAMFYAHEVDEPMHVITSARRTVDVIHKALDACARTIRASVGE